MANETEIKLYLCDGCACGVEPPDWCYLNGGECCHTAYIDHSASKNLSDLIPKTSWRDLGNNISYEAIDMNVALKKIIG